MSNGLCIGLDEFKRLKQKDQIACLYENQVKTLEMIQGYKFYYKVTATLLGLSFSAIGFLFYLINK
jgi:hypothetical protein